MSIERMKLLSITGKEEKLDSFLAKELLSRDIRLRRRKKNLWEVLEMWILYIWLLSKRILKKDRKTFWIIWIKKRRFYPRYYN